MIIANGNQFSTLKDNLYVNGKKVMAAYANGKLVYPERGNNWVMKIIGGNNFSVSHGGTGPYDIDSTTQASFFGGGSISGEIKMSLVITGYDEGESDLIQWGDEVEIPQPEHLGGGYISNASVVFDSISVDDIGFITPAGDVFHPMIGAPATKTHRLLRGTSSIRDINLELLLDININVSACGWFRSHMAISFSNPYRLVNYYGLSGSVTKHPFSGVNGQHMLCRYQANTSKGILRYLYIPIETNEGSASCQVHFKSLYGSSNMVVADYIQLIMVGNYCVNQQVTGRRGSLDNDPESFEHIFATRNFCAGYVPFSKLLYSGMATDAELEDLHPSADDFNYL